RLGASARGAWILLEQDELRDLDGLFREYAETAEIERRAWAAGAAGGGYEASRPEGGVDRHNRALGWDNRQAALVMERAAAARALRLLRAGRSLRLAATISVTRGGPYQSQNVVAEIRGATRPDEIVIVGAHLDSWDLGQGTLDNGANCAMVI